MVLFKNEYWFAKTNQATVQLEDLSLIAVVDYYYLLRFKITT
jgi:hypothetical protein